MHTSDSLYGEVKIHRKFSLIFIIWFEIYESLYSRVKTILTWEKWLV